ncbi:MAG: beta-aspartyl-peptidase (threonine type) [Sphingobacteriales bacterium]|jgi:beta-aspartyl-peptidase (threonine type)
MQALLTITTALLISFSSYAQNYVMVIHGGAGTILKKNMSDSMENAYRKKLEEALRKGHSVLKMGGTSVDAVQQAINIMEDSPLFNSAKGAVFTEEGKNELDASIMSGKTLSAGAVAGVTTIKNPINAARAVMENSPHVMMSGKGAEEFAKAQGLEIVPNSYFFTQPNFDRLKKAQENEKKLKSTSTGYIYEGNPDYKYGTVGAVALDKSGDLAAGTSTGGMTNKKYGRIGDSPIIGAGTYANNNTCAISCTGHGEYFIKNVVAFDVSARMEYQNMSLNDAAEFIINEKLKKIGAAGGLIGLDKNGNITMPFNTSGMYRGAITKDGNVEIFLYKD